MMISKTFRRLMLVAVVALGTMTAAGAAQAGNFGISVGSYGHSYGYNHSNYSYNNYSYQPTYTISYETRQVPYIKYVTEYDSYGCPVVVAKTFYTIETYAVRHLAY